MSPKRGDRVAPPAIDDEYEIRFANSEAVEGWENLCRQAAANTRQAFEKIRAAPRFLNNPGRQHRLKGALGSGVFKGQEFQRWQYEVTGGGRIWYLIDDINRTAWIVYAGTGHPKMTD